MILYANGCSHTAAAEAVVPAAFAEDDGRAGIDRRPHPANLAASWCTHLARDLGWTLVCDAESGSSNDRIIRTTKEWIDNNPNQLHRVFMVIQWSTWEREEWFHKGTWYQVNASGADWVPAALQRKYKQFVIDVDWDRITAQAHEQIWTFHNQLQDLKIPHLFYNGYSTFYHVHNAMSWNQCYAIGRQDWGTNYIDPYNKHGSYYEILQQNGYVPTKWYHFDAKGHCFWAQYLLQYIKQNNLVPADAILTN